VIQTNQKYWYRSECGQKRPLFVAAAAAAEKKNSILQLIVHRRDLEEIIEGD
jgi:hypothetical protein